MSDQNDISGTDDEAVARPWRTSRMPYLVGAKEAAQILGIQKMTLRRWLEPGSGTQGPENTRMIPPVAPHPDSGLTTSIAAGPVWVRSDVVRFEREIGRQRAPATKSTASSD